MSSVKTGRTSAVETGQMSAAETGQMSSVARTNICLVSTHNVEVSEASTVAMSQCSSLRGLSCGNVTLFKYQKSQLWQCHNVQVSEVSTVQVADKRSGPKSTKMARNGGRQVLRIGPRASPGRFLASGTGPAARNRQNRAQTPDQPPPSGRYVTVIFS